MRPCQFVLPVCIRPSKGPGETKNPKSGIFFKNLLVRNCQAECTEINMGASGACLDVKLCSAWPLAPGKGAQGASLHFGNGHQNVVVSRASVRLESNFV